MEKFKHYDEICATALQWLIYNRKEHNKNLCFTNIDSSQLEDRWLLSIASALYALENLNIYISINFFDYLVLKYKYKYKFLKFTLTPEKYFIIDGSKFEQEIVEAFKESFGILQKIYNEYYRR